MANKPKKDDVGTVVRLNMQENVSVAGEHSEEAGNGIVFLVTKPSGVTDTWINCTVYQNNYFDYTVVAGDLDVPSEENDDIAYLITPKFSLGSWEGHGDTVKMYVYDTQQPPG